MNRRVLPNSPAVGHINVTPLIDVVMCLIIFYLIVGQLASARIEEVNLPTTRSGVETRPGEGLVINILPGAKVHLGVDLVSITELTQALKARPGQEVQIRADKSLSYGEVQPVLRACREAGLTKVRLVTQKADMPGGAR
ncbi:MAG: biopolymer transporter ExbD [Planctomycetota bacterium]|nr:biopolymer transporter ExbD [Planctomycetota bacterium]